MLMNLKFKEKIRRSVVVIKYRKRRSNISSLRKPNNFPKKRAPKGTKKENKKHKYVCKHKRKIYGNMKEKK